MKFCLVITGVLSPKRDACLKFSWKSDVDVIVNLRMW